MSPVPPTRMRMALFSMSTPSRRGCDVGSKVAALGVDDVDIPRPTPRDSPVRRLRLIAFGGFLLLAALAAPPLHWANRASRP